MHFAATKKFSVMKVIVTRRLFKTYYSKHKDRYLDSVKENRALW